MKATPQGPSAPGPRTRSGHAIDYGGPCARCGERHAIDLTEGAAAAALDLLALLCRSERLPTPPGGPAGPLLAPRLAEDGGQMIGVLLARTPSGATLRLRAFSGAWDGQVQVPGWAPPLAFADGLPAWRREGEARLDALGAAIASERAATSDEGSRLSAALVANTQRDARRLAELRTAHRRARAERRAQREALSEANPGPETEASIRQQRALDAVSRVERRQLRELRQHQQREALRLEAALASLTAAETELVEARRALSRQLMSRIHGAYRIPDRNGALHPLSRAFGRPDAMPSGVGDCCAPKLIGWASRLGYTPIGLAEFWFGSPPPAGGRRHGELYGACARACQPLLGFMLCPMPDSSRRE
ncbi:MAG: hypothetical protein H6648_10005 [Caldilineae bacterium]|nr:hypothetical protein [Caldilineae bacterium]